MISAILSTTTTPTTIPILPSGTATYGQSSTTTSGGLTVIQSGPSALGILADVLSVVVVLALVGLLVIIIIANRADPDPSGRRPQSVYFFAVSFVTLLTVRSHRTPRSAISESRVWRSTKTALS